MKPYPDRIIDKANRIKLLVLDVDGVLSDGRLYFDNAGGEIKSFNVKDGLGMKLAQQAGITLAIITGRQSRIVAERASALGIQHVYQGHEDKRDAFETLLNTCQISRFDTAYMGDDLPDLTLMQQVGLSMTPADAHWYVKERADWSSEYAGGMGAVREACDLLLIAQRQFDTLCRRYVLD